MQLFFFFSLSPHQVHRKGHPMPLQPNTSVDCDNYALNTITHCVRNCTGKTGLGCR